MHAAYEESRSVRAAWRLIYNYAPTDPRYLYVTEEEMVRDLLVRHFRARESQVSEDPNAAAAEDVALDEEKTTAMRERAKTFLEDPNTQKGIKSLRRGGISSEEWEDRQKPRTIRLSGRHTTLPRKIVKP